ncbi:hypothetical protein PR003_g616 [Phytophthora rubi]|uniref:Tyr recombinase domain-containing protein n=1 Tax=Phytophthora rubi TaxID=129364 RepID=A0A6A4FXW9_9STRA|nr:hypothetical protein PR001_g1798 [Phytophthora rubi]KAE9359649.1 hypothetical protein PR003_g616 [Phytophthora rubi]
MTFQWFVLKDDDIVTVDATGRITTNPGAAEAVFIRLHGSKTNQDGKPVSRMLVSSRHVVLCPVFGALLLKQARAGLPGTTPAAMFWGRDGVPNCVTAAIMSRAIQGAAASIGEDPARYGTHSLRAGGATNMYRAGVDSLTIQLHGRWTLDAFKLRTRLCTESIKEVANKIISGARSPLVLQ